MKYFVFSELDASGDIAYMTRDFSSVGAAEQWINEQIEAYGDRFSVQIVIFGSEVKCEPKTVTTKYTLRSE